MRLLSGKRLLLGVFLLVAVLVLAACGGAPAPEQKGGQGSQQAAAPKFPSKDITFIVPVSPGGGFDTYARLLAPVLQKYLPNNVNVVVKNVPGGEWNIGLTQMYKAEPDGHTIAIFNMPGNVVNQVLGEATYDLKKVSWLGKITDVQYVGALSPKSKFKTLEDLKKAPEVKAGVVGLSSTAGLSTVVFGDTVGIKIKYINHDGSQEALLAAVRGDVDYVQYPYPTMKKFTVDSKDLVPFVVFSDQRIKTLPDTPTIGELGYPELVKKVRMDYLVGTTPGVPEENLKVLRDAFAKAVADPEFVAGMEKANAPVNAGDAKEAMEVVQAGFQTLEPMLDFLRANRK